jgi:hypothetical protein
MLVQELTNPSDASGAATVLMDFFDFRRHLNAVTKKDWRFKLPIGDPDQCECRHIGVFGAESRQHAETQQAVSNRLAKG